MQAAQIDRAVTVAAEILGHQFAGVGQFLDRLGRQLRIHLEPSAKLMLEVAEGREHVPLFGHSLEQEYHRGARALDRVFGDAEFLGHHVGGAKADAHDVASEHVGIAAHHFERLAPVLLVDAPCVAGSDPVAAQKDRQLAQSRGVAPGHRDSRGYHGAQAPHLAQTFGRIVEHRRQRLAKVLGDAPRERRARRPLSRRRGSARARATEAGRTVSKSSTRNCSPYLRMALEAAAQAQARADVEPGQAANHGDAAAEDLVATLEHRDRIAALFVDV